MEKHYVNRGYLLEDFRLFHLKGGGGNVDWHYHTFHKVIILLDGQVSYDIEGQTYQLTAGDVLLVGCGDVHRPVFLEGSPYDRIILYIAPEFLELDCDLGQCFAVARQRFSFVLPPRDGTLVELAKKLENSIENPGFAEKILGKSLFFQLMVQVNRGILDENIHQPAQYDEKIRQVLQCIHNHLTEPLSLGDIAAQCYMSQYHMMRRFKAETGYSIHQYRANKRLFLAKELMKKGRTSSEACYDSGFRDYSTFAKAYKKQFGNSPNEG